MANVCVKLSRMTCLLPVSNAPQRAKLTARDFWTLADGGAFDGFAKVELIEGELWAMNAVHSWHARALIELGSELKASLNGTKLGLTVYGSGSVAMDDASVPEPDLSVGERHTDGALPLAKLKLAIELSDTTIADDLGRKVRLYGSHNVPEYWVVDRDSKRIIQMWEPSEDGYAQRLEIAFGIPVYAATLTGVVVETGELA
jgi:Uma2 family endonuclease